MKSTNGTILSFARLALGVTPTQSLAQSTYEPYTFTTLAGSARQSGSADGTGSAARFNDPQSVEVANQGTSGNRGSIYISANSGATWTQTGAPTSDWRHFGGWDQTFLPKRLRVINSNDFVPGS